MSGQEPPATDSPRLLSGRYEIHRKIARGGMAEVYLARDRSLDRPVAVKVLFPEFATDPAFVERFRREAQAAANLAHPNIVGVYDWGTEGGTYFIVMEFVDGQSLAEVMRAAGPLHPRRAAEIAFEVAGALGFAHAKGVVHRDVKPGNVIISTSGAAKVTDFGIARALSSPSEDLTAAGAVMGTATYFSPEQAQGFAVDARSDLYSLGVVLFEMVTGRPPFTGDSPVAIAYKHVQETPPRPSQFVSEIPVGLEAIVGRLLAKDPDHRYLSADDLRADLRRWLDGQTPVALAALQGWGPPALGDNPTVAVAPVIDPSATRVATPAVAAAPPTGSTPTYPPTGEVAAFDDEDRPRRTGLFIAMLVVLLAVVAGLVFWLVKSISDNNSTAAKISVPKVIGLKQADATDKLAAKGLQDSVSSEANDTTAAGLVFDQSPKPGDKIAKNGTVFLKVSTGPATIAIPKLANLNLTPGDAQAKLTTAGFTGIITPTPTASDTVPINKVIDTDPTGGTDLPATSPIKLLVSTGPAGTPIPDVSGKTVAQARSALVKAGFIVGTVTQQPSSVQDSGNVISTSPTGSAPPNSTVNIVVSSGAQQVTIPGVKGQSETDATAVLKGKGLNVEVDPSTLPAGDPNIGRVISVSPAAGTMVDAQSTVTITVGVAGSTTTTSGSSGTTTTAGP